MSNKSLVPEAKDAMNKFKMESASEVGVSLKNGYNGDLTSNPLVFSPCPLPTAVRNGTIQSQIAWD